MNSLAHVSFLVHLNFGEVHGGRLFIFASIEAVLGVGFRKASLVVVLSITSCPWLENNDQQAFNTFKT